MKEEEFKSVESVADEVFDRCQEWFESATFAGVRAALKRASATLPENYSVSLDVSFRVFDGKRMQSLPVFSTGINTTGGREPHLAEGDSTVHRYVLNGEICQIPHNYCPSCWNVWDFKLQNPVCEHCGVEMGNQVKILLDTDTCPSCEQGTVTLDKPMCERCGFLVDQNIVSWG